MKNKLIPILGLLLATSACGRPTTSEPEAYNKIWNGGVAKAAVAPDGTTLWVTRWYGNEVFFACSGTKWQTQDPRTETDGKGHTTTRVDTEDHEVPTGDPVQSASQGWGTK